LFRVASIVVECLMGTMFHTGELEAKCLA